MFLKLTFKLIWWDDLLSDSLCLQTVEREAQRETEETKRLRERACRVLVTNWYPMRQKVASKLKEAYAAGRD